jgi:hypothetical protein
MNYGEKNELIKLRYNEMSVDEQDILFDNAIRLSQERERMGTAMALEVLYELGRLMKKKGY